LHDLGYVFQGKIALISLNFPKVPKKRVFQQNRSKAEVGGGKEKTRLTAGSLLSNGWQVANERQDSLPSNGVSKMYAEIYPDSEILISEERQALVEKAKQAAKATNEYVHGNPWQSVIIAGGVGFLIGYLASSRRN
jgi:ElaB/YqjD/DUF883 family membrane-anchored ribosome-binding protein